MDKINKTIIIPKEEAVFYMDGNGKWKNKYGDIEKKTIVDYFNSCINYDNDGFFLSQINNGIYEKVYFPYEETALFVNHINFEKGLELILNTGEKIDFIPDKIFILNDNLYMHYKNVKVKFNERTLTNLSKYFEENNGITFFVYKNKKYPLINIT